MILITTENIINNDKINYVNREKWWPRIERSKEMVGGGKETIGT